MMDKIEYVVRRKDCLYHIDDVASVVNELVREYNKLKRRLENHISKHKEYAEGGTRAKS